MFIKINKIWHSELYDLKSVYLLKVILLLSLIFWDNNFVLYLKHITLLAEKLGLITQHVNNRAIKKQMRAIWQNKTIT